MGLRDVTINRANSSQAEDLQPGIVAATGAAANVHSTCDVSAPVETVAAARNEYRRYTA